MLVTGSSGYVGRRLVARLAERGTPVRAFVHRSRADLPDGVVAVEGDVTDTASLTRACEGTEVVINLASITADRKPPQGGYDRVNAEGPAALASACPLPAATAVQAWAKPSALVDEPLRPLHNSPNNLVLRTSDSPHRSCYNQFEWWE